MGKAMQAARSREPGKRLEKWNDFGMAIAFTKVASGLAEDLKKVTKIGPSDEVIYDSHPGSLDVRDLSPDRSFLQP
ncbi:MAG TPA: hypothetical protein VFA89_04540 [Terriglobales bacterium]|nr:hypothetical protein [Terriglobales bacterium]